MRKLSLLSAALLSCSLYASAPKDVPSWVSEVTSRSAPAYPGKVPAAVLLDEQHVTFDASGLKTISSRKAVKVLTYEGRDEAAVSEYYFRGGRKVTHLRAWLVTPTGYVKSYDKSAVEDLGVFQQMELYNDIRVRRIRAENPELGSVFAYESEVQENALFAQDDYYFQSELPFVQSRYVLTLPSGWMPHAVIFNHAPVQPVVDGSTYTWELKDLPFHEREDHGPSITGLVPRLAVSFYPAGESASASIFRSWTDVSRWATSLASGQDDVTPDIVAKVRELTASASTGLQKLQAISRYVQNLKYVAINMDVAHGGGYKPHAAQLVFRNQYGDCKDKANLMRSMLKAAGIESYLVAIYAGDRTFVREEWPSPQQFNHMILGVHLADSTNLPTLMDTPSLGRLLIFDPTSDATPLGDLPWFEQGSFALLCAGDRGTLLKMPVISPESNLSDVTVDATLSGTGDLSASVANTFHGQPADIERAMHARFTPDQYRNRLAHALYHSANAVTLGSFDVQDSFQDNTFRLKMDFTSGRYGHLMQGRLLVFAPSVFEPSAPMLPATSQRFEPIIVRAGLHRKHVRIKLPPGFTVDEMPEPLQSQSEFAQFSVSFRQEAGELVMDEELKTQAANLPASDYQKVKTFFDRYAGADQQQAVLTKN